ncbi:MAG TPA: LON peptidase substrate-binding domain-containing protein [Oculatellaceae cyanobacterium]
MSAASNITTRELPLFPLPDVVLFPGCPLPLHIFEMRYRLMIADVMGKDNMFGVLNVNRQNGRVAKIGGCAKIVECDKLPDGRMNILTIGQNRFKVKEYVKEKPYLVAMVEFVEDGDSSDDLNDKALEVESLLHNVFRLSGKISNRQLEVPSDIPQEPKEFSYWIAGNLYGVAAEQQLLLEMTDTRTRLSSEGNLLDKTLKELAARAALKDAFEKN